jgi:hypothetical protein
MFGLTRVSMLNPIAGLSYCPLSLCALPQNCGAFLKVGGSRDDSVANYRDPAE